MKSKLIFTFLLLMSLHNYCQVSNENAVLEDKLTLPGMLLVWYDKFSDEHSIKQCGTANRKKFGPTRILEVKEPKLYVLPIMDQIPFLINPADTVVFYMTDRKSIFGERGAPTLKHKSNSIRTNEIKFFETVFDSIGACYGFNSYRTPDSITDFKNLIPYHSSILQKRLKFLERRKEDSLSAGFYDYAKKYFDYKFYDDVLRSYTGKKFQDSVSKINAISIADSLIANLNADDGHNFYSWYEALKGYVELQVKNSEISANEFDMVVNNISNHLEGKAKNFAIFYLYKLLLNKNTKLINSKLNLLIKHNNDQDYINYISSHYSFTNIHATGKIEETIADVNGNVKTLTSIINGLKGKVIYMDFWASWCMPCLEELPFSKQLIAEFENKDVVFIFLSTDTYAERWKKSIADNNMKNYGKHYLILDYENNSFIKKYNIEEIPRYILINKKGKLINSEAPRPSEEKTKRLITEYLEN